MKYVLPILAALTLTSHVPVITPTGGGTQDPTKRVPVPDTVTVIYHPGGTIWIYGFPE